MDRMESVLVILCAILYHVQSVEVIYGHEVLSKNLAKNDNWDFESAISSNDWVMKQSSGSLVSGANTGSRCLKVSNRAAKQGGPYLFLDTAQTGLKKNTNYYMSMFLKMQSGPGGSNPYLRVTTFARVTKSAGGTILLKTGYLNYQLPNNLWQQVGGDFKTPNVAFSKIEFFLYVEPASVSYLIDTFAVHELKRASNWKTLLNNQIAQHRKNDIRITGSISSSNSLSNTRIKVELIRHEFGFGTAIKATNFNRQASVNVNYRNFVLNYFNWVVFENDMKWPSMEKSKGAIKYTQLDQAMETLAEHNKTVRGHTLVWAIKDTNPSWVTSLSGRTLQDEVKRRIKYVMQHFKGKVYEWDVCNEYLQKHFFEEGTGKFDMLEMEFNLAHQYDPDARLCLNDYLVLRGGAWLNSNQADLAKYLLSKNIPVHCIGIQSHLRTLPMDPEILEHRLKVVAQAGLDISITEFSSHSSNVNVRAEGIDTAFRVYFANPSVSSITIWGFGDRFNPFANNHYLTNGDNFTPNAAGNKYLDLVHNEWSTKETLTPTTRSYAKTISAFRGNYKLTVQVGGVTKAEKEFYVGKGTNSVTFSI